MPYRQVLGCPRCQIPLTAQSYAIGELELCEQCGGIFADNQASRHAVGTLDRLLLLVAHGAALGRPAPRTDGPAACPKCGSVMQRVRVEAAACDVDVCAEHGTWFDPGELRAVSRAYENIRKRGGHAPGTAAPAPAESPFGVAETAAHGSPYALGLARLPEAIAGDVQRLSKETAHLRDGTHERTDLLGALVDLLTKD